MADFLIHVIDESNPERDNQITIVESVLHDIGASGKPTIGVFNKTDKLDSDVFIHSDIEMYEANVHISAKRKMNIDKLLDAISDTAPGKKCEITVELPYSDGGLLSRLHDTQKILCENYTENGIEVTLLADSETYEKLRTYII